MFLCNQHYQEKKKEKLLTVFTQINFVSDFLQTKCDFTPKTAVLRFRAFWVSLGAIYDVHLRFIRKRVVWTSY